MKSMAFIEIILPPQMGDATSESLLGDSEQLTNNTLKAMPLVVNSGNLANSTKKAMPASLRSYPGGLSNSMNTSACATIKKATHLCQLGKKIVRASEVPSFIILGVQKSGTTSLFHYLRNHPDVLPPLNFLKKAGEGKSFEVHFFDRTKVFAEQKDTSTEEEFYCKKRQKYIRKHFQGGKISKAAKEGRNLMTFDKTPIYLVKNLHSQPELISKTVPWAKYIVILRNPVDRAYSQFMMGKKTHITNPADFDFAVRKELVLLEKVGLITLPDAVFLPKNSTITSTASPAASHEFKFTFPIRSAVNETKVFSDVFKQNLCLQRGFYAIQLQAWIDALPHPEQMLVLNSDDLKRSPSDVYRRILCHVGLPEHNQPAVKKAHNARRQMAIPMWNTTRELLEALFLPQNADLGRLLGKEWAGVWGSGPVEGKEML
eukprot:CAMPEP_0194290740 /NCGR_PEP_ID=MMETSP0169-20130528/41945_1 /TAXON_ID=218684 /ORGANISM="Corethron pennatum, Strain L29A3" /LENGTH=429 /DNA_ID=CAMNT_0039038429 /DNA_START=168 /DNA_END=1457 /DNA_ORIENTATION=+